MLTIEQLHTILKDKEYTIVKYVRLTDDTIRFGDLYYAEHRDMVRKGETAASAGLVTLDLESRTAKTKGNSMTLKLNPDVGDADKITALIFA